MNNERQSNAGKPMAVPRGQAAVDAELARFDAEYRKEHGGLPTTDLDAHGEEFGGAPAEGSPSGLTMTAYRPNLQAKIAARREFIRKNPTIQRELSRELAAKVEGAKTRRAQSVLGAFVLAASLKQRRAC